jgi:fatty-acyl-CoA synthase
VGRGRPRRGRRHPGTAPGETDLLDFLDGRLARYKLPKSVVFTEELPRTATGKIRKKRVRDTYGRR